MQSDSKTLGSIIGGALITSALIFGMFYYSAQTSASKDSLSVTGSAKTQVTADQGKLIISISRMISSSGALASGYAQVSHDLALTRAFLKKEGTDDKNISESPVSANQLYDYNGSQGGETRYEIRQTITIQSNDVQKLTDLSKKIPSLASQGAIVSIQSLEYYYSKLPELRVSLLGNAIKDAEDRARMIAESTGRKVGNIRSASIGVVQVLSQNSVEVADYGAYDTSSIDKDVMVTVKASFGFR